jgi:hypothetical protein
MIATGELRKNTAVPEEHHTKRLYDRPSGGEADLVDAKLLLAVCVTNTGIDVVVVEDRAERRVVEDTLSTRTIDPIVGLENSGTATVGAGDATLVDLWKD